MATLTSTSLNQSGAFTPTTLTLGASDTFSYAAGTNPLLVFFNETASAVPILIDGSDSTTISPAGFGGTVSVAGGYTVAVPANGIKAVRLSTISAFLLGTIAMTNGTGCKAVLFV